MIFSEVIKREFTYIEPPKSTSFRPSTIWWKSNTRWARSEMNRVQQLEVLYRQLENLTCKCNVNTLQREQSILDWWISWIGLSREKRESSWERSLLYSSSESALTSHSCQAFHKASQVPTSYFVGRYLAALYVDFELCVLDASPGVVCVCHGVQRKKVRSRNFLRWDKFMLHNLIET